MLDFLDKDFKLAIINMLKDLKKNGSEEVKQLTALCHRMNISISRNYKIQPNISYGVKKYNKWNKKSLEEVRNWFGQAKESMTRVSATCGMLSDIPRDIQQESQQEKRVEGWREEERKEGEREGQKGYFKEITQKCFETLWKILINTSKTHNKFQLEENRKVLHLCI